VWKCPECGREFEQEDHVHDHKKPSRSVDEYIAMQPESNKERLNAVRQVFKETLPDTTERIAYAMPTYWKGHNIIHFAGYANHIGIYPGDAAMRHFAPRLIDYKTSKGALQLPHDKPLPLGLIKEIARWCREENNRRSY
jgi:uncharacterized protein YdhG (YjbR/CyaY superfamily)